MDEDKVTDEFRRVALTAQLEKDWTVISQYENGLAHVRRRVDRARYWLGRLDERLGVADDDR